MIVGIIVLIGILALLITAVINSVIEDNDDDDVDADRERSLHCM